MVKSMLWLLATQVSGVMVALAVGILLGRTLGAHGQGLYQLTILVPVALTLILGMGSGATPSYLIGRGTPPEAVMGFVVTVALVATLAAMVLLWVAPEIWPTVVRQSLLYPLRWILLAYIPLQTLTNGGSQILLAQDRMRGVISAGLAPRLVQIATLVGLLVTHHLAVWTASLVYVGAPLIGVVIVGWGLRASLIPKWHAAVLHQGWNFAWRGHFGNVAQFLNYRLGLYLIGVALAAEAAGLYWLGVTVSELLWYAPAALAGVLLPRVARGEKTGEESLELANALGWGMVGIGIVMAILAPWVLPALWGESFRGATPVLWMLLPGAVSFTWSKVLTGDLAGQGHPGWGSLSSGMGLLILGTGGLVAMGAHNLLIMAAAQSLSYLVATCVVVVGFIKVHRIPRAWKLLFYPRPQVWRRLATSNRRSVL